jgi:hypothetical protein
MTLEPSIDPAGDLCFSFSQAEYEDVEGQYEALSYTWGELRFEHRLYDMSKGHEAVMLITANLDAALRKLRYTLETRVIWADAVCINQRDDEEKARQIPLMTSIYHGARRVVAWLGPVVQNSDEEQGMKQLEILSRQSSHFDNQLENRFHRNAIGLERHSQNIADFLSLSWFSRLWIIQEIVLNIDVVLLCGDTKMTWARLIAALENLRTHDETWKHIVAHRRQIATLEAIADLWLLHSGVGNERLPMFGLSERHREESFIDLMDHFRGFGCADDRDRIFALFNLSSGITDKPFRRNQINMAVDYSKPIHQTYATFALACLRSSHYNCDRIFKAILRRQFAHQDVNCVSWAPDWRREPEKGIQDVGLSTWYHVRYHGHLHSKKVLIMLYGYLDLSRRYDYSIVDLKIAQGARNEVDDFFSAVLEALPSLGQDIHRPRNGNWRQSYQVLHAVRRLMNVLPRALTTLHMNKEEVWSLLSSYFEFLRKVSSSHPTKQASGSWTRLRRQLVEATKGSRFFSASIPGSTTKVIGFGNYKVEEGDRIVSFGTRMLDGSSLALILRPVRTLSNEALAQAELEMDNKNELNLSQEDDGMVYSYRLIGSARTIDLQIDESSTSDKTWNRRRSVWLE